VGAACESGGFHAGRLNTEVFLRTELLLIK
jgi:hypothetical protein